MLSLRQGADSGVRSREAALSTAPPPCPLCSGYRVDPRQGYAPREAVLYLEERIPPMVLVDLAQAIRLGGKFEITLNAPPAGGVCDVEIVSRKKYGASKPPRSAA